MCKMAEAKTRYLSFILWTICCVGNEISARDFYTNVWAVKARGSVQDVRLLALKHGLLYDKYVRKLIAKLTSNIQAKVLNAECAGNVYLINLSFKTMVFP